MEGKEQMVRTGKSKDVREERKKKNGSRNLLYKLSRERERCQVTTFLSCEDAAVSEP